MGARKTSLSVSAFTLDGTNLLANLTSASFSIDGKTVDGAGLADAFQDLLWTGGKGTGTFSINHWTSGAPSTNLSVTAWSIGGSSLLGDLQSGSLNIANPIKDVSGYSDVWEYPQAMRGRAWTLQGSLFVPEATTRHMLIEKAMSATPADHYLASIITVGADTFEATMVLNNATHSVASGEPQNLSVNMGSKGTPISSGTGIYAVIGSGDALLSLVLDTEAGQYGTGGAALVGVVTSLDMKFEKNAVVSSNITMEIQGSPTVTASS